MTAAQGPANPIDACRVCGAALAPGATFCDRCGSPRGAAPATRPPRAPAPAWLSADWPMAIGLAVLVSVALFAVCIGYGIGLGALGAGGDGVLPGAFVGALLPFAAYGGEVVGFSGSSDGNIGLLLDEVPLLLTAVAALLVLGALRRPITRLGADPTRARGLVVKVAVLHALVLAVAGGFADVGDVSSFGDGDGQDRTTFTSVAQGGAALGALLVVLAVGAVLLVRTRVRVTPTLPTNAVRALLAARAGAAALLVVALVSGVGGLLVLGAQAEGARDRFAVAASAPLTLSGFGTAAGAVAHGGAAGSTDVEDGLDEALSGLDEPDSGGSDEDDLDPEDVESCEQESESFDEAEECVDALLQERQEQQEQEGDGGSQEFDDAYRDALRLSMIERTGATHVSLADWELPLTEEAGRAPWWAFLALLVPLTGLSGATVLLLRRASPPTESWAVSLAAALGIGYALMSWLLAALSPLAVLTTGTSLQGEQLGLLLEPALGSGLGLPLLWGAVVPVATALLWSRRRGLPGNVFASRPVAARPAPGGALGPRPQGELLEGSVRAGTCPYCRGRVEPGDAFCSTCGRPV